MAPNIRGLSRIARAPGARIHDGFALMIRLLPVCVCQSAFGSLRSGAVHRNAAPAASGLTAHRGCLGGVPRISPRGATPPPHAHPWFRAIPSLSAMKVNATESPSGAMPWPVPCITWP